MCLRGKDLWNKTPQSKHRVRISFVSTQSCRSREGFIGRTARIQLCPSAAALNPWGSTRMAPSDPKLQLLLPRAGNHFRPGRNRREQGHTHKAKNSKEKSRYGRQGWFFLRSMCQTGKRCSSSLWSCSEGCRLWGKTP